MKGWNDTYAVWQLAGISTDFSSGTNLYFRTGKDSTWNAWKTLAFTDSNVASATKLQTARTLWGKSFDGTANVSGTLSGVVDITMSGYINYKLKVENTSDWSTLKFGGIHNVAFGGLSEGYAHRVYYFRPAASAQGYTNAMLVIQNCSESGVFNTIHEFNTHGAAIHTGFVQGTQFKSTIATGTQPITVNSTTQVSNLNSTYLQGWAPNTSPTANTIVRRDSNNYVHLNYINSNTANNEGSTVSQFIITNGSDNYYRKVSIDKVRAALNTRNNVIDLRSLDQNTWYPCSINLSSKVLTEITIWVSLDGNKPSWATHSSGFTLNLRWEAAGAGWGTTNVQRKILNSYYAHTPANPCGGILQNSMDSVEIVYLRGGGYYIYHVSTGQTIVAHTSGYSWVSGEYSYSAPTRNSSQLTDPSIMFGGSYLGVSLVRATDIRADGYVASSNIRIECDNNYTFGSRNSEINNYNSHLYLQHNSGKNLIVCGGGGNMGVGTTSPAYKLHINGWVATEGSTGWFNSTYGGGIYMIDSTWIRTSNGKRFYVGNTDANWNADSALSTNGGIFATKGIYTNDWFYAVYGLYLNSGSAFTYASNYPEISSNGSELVVSTTTANMYVNYRTGRYRTTVPTNWLWNAGSSTSWANHKMGSLTLVSGLSVGGSATVAGTLSVSSTLTTHGITQQYTGGSWISLATRSNIIHGSISQSKDSAHGLFRLKNYTGSAICYGGLGVEVGFYGFLKSRIDAVTNGVDWYTIWNVDTGTLTHGKDFRVLGATTLSSTLSVSSTSTLSGVVNAGSTLNVGGILNANNTTDATSTTAASLVCDGGVGVVKQLRVGGAATLSSTLSVSSTATIAGVLNNSNTTDATSTTAAAMKTAGGLGVAKQLRVGGASTLASTLSVTGATTLTGRLTANGGISSGYSNTSYQVSVSSFICNSWIRTTGQTGWYNETYGGGIYMIDSTYVRTYNSKKFYVNNTDSTDFSTESAISTSGGIFATKNITSNANIYAAGAITAKVSSSDMNLKTDVSDYDALSIIRSLASIKYHWNETAKSYSPALNHNDWNYGLKAQELLLKGYNQWVGTAFEYYTIDYERLSAVMWKGIQQIDDEQTKLKKRVEALEKEILRLGGKVPS